MPAPTAAARYRPTAARHRPAAWPRTYRAQRVQRFHPGINPRPTACKYHMPTTSGYFAQVTDGGTSVERADKRHSVGETSAIVSFGPVTNWRALLTKSALTYPHRSLSHLTLPQQSRRMHLALHYSVPNNVLRFGFRSFRFPITWTRGGWSGAYRHGMQHVRRHIRRC